MAQNTRSDQGMPQIQQGQTMDMSLNNEATIQQILNERNSLRSQNDQLWKIIEKQRVIIQNLQKDVTKITAERDFLRQSATTAVNSNSLHDQTSYEPNGYYPSIGQQQQQQQQHPSKRSMERKAHDNDINGNTERELEQASGFNGDTSFSSTTSSHEHRQHQHQQQQQQQQQQQSPYQNSHHRHPQYDLQSPRQNGLTQKPHPNGGLPLTPSSTYESDFEGTKTEPDQEEIPAQSNGYEQSSIHPYDHDRVTRTPPEEDSYDRESQGVSVATRVQYHLPNPQQASSHHERDPRAVPNRSEPTHPLDGLGRNISGSITIPSHLMPHLPPRSPRRERKDDNCSPSVSDNEEESPAGSRRKGPSAGGPLASPMKPRGDVPDMLSSANPSHHDLDVPDSGYSSMQRPKQGNVYDSPSPLNPPDHPYQPTSTYIPATPNSPGHMNQNFPGSIHPMRKNVSGQVPSLPNTLTAQTMISHDFDSSSPTNGLNGGSLPTSPIAAIIDQDAEKYRVYMSKLGNPNRRGPSGANNSDNQDHAMALGQAVALENIQAQIEIQNQLKSQNQGQSQGLPRAYGQDQWQGTIPSLDALGNNEHHNGGSGYHEEPIGGSNIPRERRRQSSLPVLEGYPKIAARSTSHQYDEDDSAREYNVPLPPKRFDSQPMMDSSTARSASPTPSGNSSVNNTLTNVQPSGLSRGMPTVHQQNFQMFGDNLEFVSVIVVGSNIRTNDKGKEILTFLVSIGHEVQTKEGTYPHKENDEVWRVEKQYMEFINLDSKLRVTQSRNIINNLPKLPDKSLFSNHAPSKVDARKVALEQYLQQLTSLRIKDTRDLCEFLCTNVVERAGRKEIHESGWKEGYLTKRGKNFGGWKTRFFVLRGPILEYFDIKDGHHLGSIILTHAQIGRQQTSEKQQDSGENKEGPVDPNSYRHAFLILEPKKGQSVADAKRNPNNVTRHVLCAETDEERDEWVDALLRFVGKDINESADTGSNDKERSGRRMPEIQKVAATPIKDLASVKGNEKLLLNQEAYERQQRSIPPSGPNQQNYMRGGNMPLSPTTPNMCIDDRLPAERQSAEGQYANNRQNYNQYSEQGQQSSWNSQQPFQNQQQYQQQQQQQYHQQQLQNHQQQDMPPPGLPRNQSTHSLNQIQDDGPYKTSAEGQTPAPQLTPQEIAEKKQRSRMTFHWPKKAAKEEPVVQSGTNGAPQNSKDASTSGANQDSSRLRNFLGKGNSNTTNNGNAQPSNLSGGARPGDQGSYAGMAPARQVFGVSLEQAMEQGRVQPGYELPAVVYRCIEYLNAHKAKHEEGIYRLNGSSAVIKNLKERFNQEGDVPLLASEDYYDIHAVAGLLKLFLRELPNSVLTRELHKEFLAVIELPNRTDRVDELTRLVAILPEVNYTLLRALTAHLIEIVDNADVNKMTARNVGIVFSPTLGIPAGVFALLMSSFDQIFHTHDGRIMPLENSDMRNGILADTSANSDGLMMA
ncbi:hypothetical protein FBU30_002085 [Linnemannia zychae]|nr:hypothetical protein FBU30_002085 [Linnemannia zychae]